MRLSLCSALTEGAPEIRAARPRTHRGRSEATTTTAAAAAHTETLNRAAWWDASNARSGAAVNLRPERPAAVLFRFEQQSGYESCTADVSSPLMLIYGMRMAGNGPTRSSSGREEESERRRGSATAADAADPRAEDDCRAMRSARLPRSFPVFSPVRLRLHRTALSALVAARLEWKRIFRICPNGTSVASPVWIISARQIWSAWPSRAHAAPALAMHICSAASLLYSPWRHVERSAGRGDATRWNAGDGNQTRRAIGRRCVAVPGEVQLSSSLQQTQRARPAATTTVAHSSPRHSKTSGRVGMNRQA